MTKSQQKPADKPKFGLQAVFADMISSLPSADSDPVASDEPQEALQSAPLPAAFADMFAVLPDAAPGDEGKSIARGLDRAESGTDFKLQDGVELKPFVAPAPESSRTVIANANSSATNQSGRSLPTAPARRAATAPQSPQVHAVASPPPAVNPAHPAQGWWQPSVQPIYIQPVYVQQSIPVPPVVQAPVVKPPTPAPAIGHRLESPSAVARRATSAAPAASPAAGPTGDAAPSVDDDLLHQRVREELGKYSIQAVNDLQIDVREGLVTIVGQVPGSYERQLILHFARKVSGVTEVVDMMRIVEDTPKSTVAEVVAVAAAKPVVKAKSKRTGPTYRSPWSFEPKQLATVAGVLVLLGAGYFFMIHDSSKLSLSPVTGKVLFQGKPAEGAVVVLHPVDKSVTIRPKGFVGPDGTFKLTSYLPGDGAPRGEHKVTVEWKKPIQTRDGEFVPGPNLLPPELNSPDSSKIQVTVASGETVLEPLQISGR